MSTYYSTPTTSLYNVKSLSTVPMILLTLSTTTLTYYSTLTLSSSASLSNDASFDTSCLIIPDKENTTLPNIDYMKFIYPQM